MVLEFQHEPNRPNVRECASAREETAATGRRRELTGSRIVGGGGGSRKAANFANPDAKLGSRVRNWGISSTVEP